MHDFTNGRLLSQVFMSVDEPDAGSQETPSGEDGTPTMTTLVPPAAAPQEERPLVEFDSPDSGLPSSRNYSVTSAHSQILSSIDDGQSTEEEGVGGDEGRTAGVPPSRRDSLTEDKLCSQLDKLVTSGAAADGIPPSLSSYTVRRSESQCRSASERTPQRRAGSDGDLSPQRRSSCWTRSPSTSTG